MTTEGQPVTAEEWRAWFRERGWSIAMDDRPGQPTDPFGELATRAAPEVERLRAWLIEQAAQAKASAEHPQTWPDEAMKDRGARHMAEATLTWMAENLLAPR